MPRRSRVACGTAEPSQAETPIAGQTRTPGKVRKRRPLHMNPPRRSGSGWWDSNPRRGSTKDPGASLQAFGIRTVSRFLAQQGPAGEPQRRGGSRKEPNGSAFAPRTPSEGDLDPARQRVDCRRPGSLPPPPNGAPGLLRPGVRGAPGSARGVPGGAFATTQLARAPSAPGAPARRASALWARRRSRRVGRPAGRRKSLRRPATLGAHGGDRAGSHLHGPNRSAEGRVARGGRSDTSGALVGRAPATELGPLPGLAGAGGSLAAGRTCPRTPRAGSGPRTLPALTPPGRPVR